MATSPVDDEGNPIPVTIPIAISKDISVIFTTRLGGVSQDDYASLNLGGLGGDNIAHVQRNRASIAHEIQADLSLVKQVHSARVVDVDEIFKNNTEYGFDATGMTDDIQVEADAQVTSKTNCAIGVFAADCLPVLFADLESGIIGVAHCGRKGLLQGVIENTVNAMLEKGSSRENIVAVIGPCICGNCYEVGDEIADEFEKRFPLTKTTTRFGGTGIDIQEAAMIDLSFAGITKIAHSRPRVEAATQYLAQDEELTNLCEMDSEGASLSQRLQDMQDTMCTFENALWYSHRRSSKSKKQHEGRFAAFIMRRG
ncbi:MAG: polyphenol oxidase family protein [Bifidobacteriaceae bacterium]|nr:polyphenol oxidase family protein [Bifidobacteriaceae bacterium]